MLRHSVPQRVFRASRPTCLASALALALVACGGETSPTAPETSSPPSDSLAPPADTTTPPTPPDSSPAPPPPDSSPAPPPPDSSPAPPPPDSNPAPPPPDSTPAPPAGPPVQVGIPFGPSIYTQHESANLLVPPSELSPSFTALKIDAYKYKLLAALEAARRANGRILVSFSGGSAEYTDSNGFNLELWKREVDEFRDFDLSSYIADGTLIGHYIMDEPSDRRNWNGHLVARADIDEMARYSKEIWPDLPTIIRGWPWYLKGYSYRYLDAAWAAYHERFGSMDAFIASNVRDAKESGLALVVGLNVLAGGGEGGLPGYHSDKFAMTASQVRSWGGALLDQPYLCAFFMFRYNPDYFRRADIQAVMAELSQKARRLENRTCRRP